MKSGDLLEAISETLMEKDFDTAKTEVERLGSFPRGGAVDERLVMYHKPKSLEAEFYRFLRSRIEQHFRKSGKGRDGKVILLTGPSLGSGKTTCSLNLALAFARSYGKRALFVDTDSRKEGSAKYLGIGKKELPGFVDVLSMKARAGSVLVKTGLSDLIYFPSGKFNEHFVDTLRNYELGLLFASLKQHFRFIILDTPPAYPMPEASILAQHCDGVLVVLKANRDKEQDLVETLEALGEVPLLGIILNGIKYAPGQRYGTYGYYGKDSR